MSAQLYTRLQTEAEISRVFLLRSRSYTCQILSVKPTNTCHTWLNLNQRAAGRVSTGSLSERSSSWCGEAAVKLIHKPLTLNSVRVRLLLLLDVGTQLENVFLAGRLELVRETEIFDLNLRTETRQLFDQ